MQHINIKFYQHISKNTTLFLVQIRINLNPNPDTNQYGSHCETTHNNARSSSVRVATSNATFYIFLQQNFFVVLTIVVW